MAKKKNTTPTPQKKPKTKKAFAKIPSDLKLTKSDGYLLAIVYFPFQSNPLPLLPISMVGSTNHLLRLARNFDTLPSLIHHIHCQSVNFTFQTSLRSMISLLCHYHQPRPS